MEEKITDERLLCIMLEITYDNKRKDETTNIQKLYPSEWFSSLNDNLKIKILSEALKNDCLIIKTNLYKKTIEGVKY